MQACLEEREASLRAKLQNKPSNAKAMSQLSNVLFDMGCAAESLDWARKAVLTTPHKPFTHATLSRVATEYKEKIKALESTVETFEDLYLSTDSAVSEISHQLSCSYAVALARLLVEPREEERNQWLVDKKMQKNKTAKNPIRKDLNQKEKALYVKLKAALQTAWVGDQIPLLQVQHLAMTEYRLGVFFRKMEPERTHQPSSQIHLNQVTKQLTSGDKLAKKARFWQATMGDPDSTISDSDKPECDRCPEEYIVSLYSSFASNFDELLVNKLDYQTPTILRGKVDSLFSKEKQKSWNRGLDMGCGTGLSGLAFRDCVKFLAGVDLSPEMIDKASERKCYDQLSVEELEKNLMGRKESFDLVVACDVFVYIGDLDSIFGAVRKVLNTSSVFAFSTEWLPEDRKRDFHLQTTARFAHKQSYIEKLCTKHNFQIHSIDIANIRRNKGKDIKGILAVLGI